MIHIMVFTTCNHYPKDADPGVPTIVCFIQMCSVFGMERELHIIASNQPFMSYSNNSFVWLTLYVVLCYSQGVDDIL